MVNIKAIDATLPNDDLILRWERLSKRGKVPEGSTRIIPLINGLNEMI